MEPTLWNLCLVSSPFLAALTLIAALLLLTRPQGEEGEGEGG